jgi:ribosomal protein S27AE
MRIYRKRVPQVRHCVHCGDAFESAHKSRIYCGNSCSTLAYYARKAQASPPLVTAALSAVPLGTLPAAATTESPTPPAVTLALNAQNLALFTAGPLLADGIKQAIQFVGKLLAPVPQAGPSTWLPALFRLVKQPLVTFQHVEWDEPRFFVPVQWQGAVFYYRAAQDLLFWQAPDGQCYQLTQQAHFEEILRQLQLQRIVQQVVPTYAATALTRGLPLPPSPLKDLG